MSWTTTEILETLRMTEVEHLDIRTITMGISLRGLTGGDAASAAQRVYDRVSERAGSLIETVDRLSRRLGIPVANKRVAITPVAVAFDNLGRDGLVQIAQALDRAAANVGIDYIAGYSALVDKGSTRGDEDLIASIPEAIGGTERVCASVNVASSRAGINLDAVAAMGRVIKRLAEATRDRDAVGCAKLVVFCNVPEDNPFIAGAFHGISEPETVINVGVSGPGVILDTVRRAGKADARELAEQIKLTAFRVTRAGELLGRRVAADLGIPFGIVDLSLAPTPEPGDSVGEVLKAIGLEDVGAPGTTAALALLTDAMKRGGLMASSSVGGLSGAFIPVSEDAAMVSAVQKGHLSLEKLEALTAVCSVGLDMIALPGDTPAETLAAIIADECAIGMVNHKTTATRLIPVPGKTVGDVADYGGLMGQAPIMAVSTLSPARFISRGGQIPQPVTGVRN
ncbi:MAG: PFL family protein [Candidatus Marinimicrobia bacterium]|nr:PFL family protein [Candidatus Neomarinimicrobiota bacterium]